MRSAGSLEDTDRQLSLDAAYAHVVDVALVPSAIGPVGLELEAHLVDLDSVGQRVRWPRLRAVIDGLPAMPGSSRVTVEPGGQVELSGPPHEDVGAAVTALRTDRACLSGAFSEHRLGLAHVGTDPLRSPGRVSPAARYAAMEQHFVAMGCGAAGAAMMTTTASLQVNVNAGPASGWADRVRLAHQLGPVLIAVSACSPLARGRETGWRSNRQRCWAELDPARCGPLPDTAAPAQAWAAYAMAAPVMLVRTPHDGAEPVRTRTSFAGWVTRGQLGGRRPTLADLDYHLSTLFPPVRLRGYLELRYLDAAPEPWWPALAAVTTTLLDDPVASERAAEVTAPVSGAWQRAARLGLADGAIHSAARACLAAAADRVSLGLRAEVGALAELVDQGRSPGDAVQRIARRAGPRAALLDSAQPEELVR
jgi:ergothioneine biosynthesis glutamate--cysteine ligase EgtA